MQQSVKRRAARSPVVMLVRKHLNVVLAVLTSLVVFALTTSRQFNASNFLASWNWGAVVYIAFTWYRMLRSNVSRIRQRSADCDFSDVLVLCLSIAAAVASIGGIGIELSGVKNASPAQALENAGTAFLTILISWVFLHTLFTTHYAHRFYADSSGKPPIRFPDDIKEPNYWDFLYFTFTIGVASQTADVAIATTSMRKTALLHSVLSFLFNTTILALAINVGASLI
ncbi:DUF1345 domain-containing protein [Rhizobium sp. VS19-DR104.2]|uniref:DUF1345 domain-containing protein n=1 Tax=unclassified Rhizobium TaxID=2613769 RepID=UPI001C5B3971|nr:MULTISPECIES: DUF1345 domain-containing protein [unclassified Rhizobium]MBZ5759202.1 DUF1345 domain-containing protein [Rhizobium sp. VS19-DR96]MBZ5763967.1 DUF1345 domain-containing protein [Rhizobium sp. VS19-DR129.2]MBZ5771511.1 DUF1345 domain-containing protein [Rhizobium sp. VS19-DRK62.2]MBZ5783802.1 DUF1345 domain-containing protein [Rhizobium sp. VS19-DR121]MBZ5801524.1 DUF1345 domain-containing protein [Rhizobium sp. VS19-DR181]